MSDAGKDGGPAFAHITRVHDEPRWMLDPTGEFPAQPLSPETVITTSGGMSLRDYFAAAAIPTAFKFYDDGYCSADTSKDSRAVEIIGAVCYEIANAMLAARETK